MFRPMSAFAVCNSCDSPFLEVWFNKILLRRVTPWGWASRLVLPNPILSEVLHVAVDVLHSALLKFFGVSLSWPSLPWHLLSVRLDAFLHRWAPSVWFWLYCVINLVEDHLLASASLTQSVFVVTFFIGSFYCHSVRFSTEWVPERLRTFTKSVREDDSDRNLSSRKMSDDVIVLDLVLGRSEVVTPKPS